MAISKVYGVNLILYLLLNAIFFLIYMAVGGVDLSAGFIGTITQDWGGFVAAVITPGGTEANIFSSTHYFLTQLYENYDIAITKNVIGLLWIWVPGLLSSIIAGRKYSWESTKAAFWGTTFAIFTLTALTIVFIFVPIFGVAEGTPIVATGLSEIFQTVPLPAIYVSKIEQSVMILFYGFMNALVFGGIAAASSNEL